MTYKEFIDLKVGTTVYKRPYGDKYIVVSKGLVPKSKRGYNHGVLYVENAEGEVSVVSFRPFKLKWEVN